MSFVPKPRSQAVKSFYAIKVVAGQIRSVIDETKNEF